MTPFEEEDEEVWPDEPSEFDPESLGPDRPRTPSVGADETDVDEETFRAFWGAVVMVNVGLFCAPLGLMLWYFRGQALLGGGLVVVGSLALLRAYLTYRDYTGSDDESDDESDDATDDGRDGSPADSPDDS